MARLTAYDLEVAGEHLSVRGDRSVFWPRVRTLVVADLHVGKTESLRGDGVAVPDGSMFDDLVRLSAAIEDTGANRVIVIGDFVHDARGLTPVVRAFVARWRRTVPCRLDLVIGNHDRRVPTLPDEWEIVCHDPALVESPLAFSHDDPVRGRYTLLGHVHPSIRLSGGGDGVRVPCFHVGERAMTLPAFSTLTAGAPVAPARGELAVAVVQGFVIPIVA
ncbi:MAG: ligase-associated DNA damage response endonuclease PdeM [Gemmatimonadaceae bacterium]|nr:ligase-associated DNA damage response endonuclease PdeM [Gemmatimonadaceae bacterium]